MWAMEQRAAAVRPEKSQEEGRDQARLQSLSVTEGQRLTFGDYHDLARAEGGEMGELLGILIWGLLAGVIIGPLARLVLPGKQNISLIMTIVVGAVGAILGGLIADWLGVGDTDGIDWIKHAIQVGVAAVVVVVYGSMSGRSTTA
jgi:uncharacterized membrane protein YeaQ/YmgE (transglycosylase-associated protein family)